MIGALYHEVLYRPLLNALVFFYNTVALEDLGLSIVLLTLLIRAILYPVFQKSARHTMVMQHLQPEVKKIQDKHPKDRQKQGEEMLSLYKKHNVNPFSGFFFLFLQLPILIALFQIFSNIVKPDALTPVYSFLARPENLHTTFLSLIPLQKSSIVIASIAALAQYFQTRLSTFTQKNALKGSESPAERMTKQMSYIMPVVTLMILMRFPSALGIYWITTSLVSILQQKLIARELAHVELERTHQGNDDPGRV